MVSPVDNLTVVDKENVAAVVPKKKESIPTKVVLRCLPPTMTEESLKEQLEPIPDHNYFYFMEADISLNPFAFCRAYIDFVMSDDVMLFRDRFDGYVFLDSQGNEYSCLVELAPWQKIPKKSKVDVKCGTIDEDPEFKKFVDSYENPEPIKPLSLDERLQEIATRKKEAKAPKVTPLIEFMGWKKDERARRREDRKKQDDERRRRRDDERKRKEKEDYERQQRENEKRKKREKEREERRKSRIADDAKPKVPAFAKVDEPSGSIKDDESKFEGHSSSRYESTIKGRGRGRARTWQYDDAYCDEENYSETRYRGPAAPRKGSGRPPRFRDENEADFEVPTATTRKEITRGRGEVLESSTASAAVKARIRDEIDPGRKDEETPEEREERRKRNRARPDRAIYQPGSRGRRGR